MNTLRMPVNGSFAMSLWFQVDDVQLLLWPAWLHRSDVERSRAAPLPALKDREDLLQHAGHPNPTSAQLRQEIKSLGFTLTLSFGHPKCAVIPLQPPKER